MRIVCNPGDRFTLFIEMTARAAVTVLVAATFSCAHPSAKSHATFEAAAAGESVPEKEQNTKAIAASQVKTVPTSLPAPQGKPDNKKILSLLFENMDVPLSLDPSCNGVGTSFQDSTIGQYLSGFWAYQANNDGGNFLDIEIVPKKSVNDTVERWEARVLIRRYDGEEIWAWGVSFEISGQDHHCIRETFRCLGAG